ncbi:MAG: hypothetical protein HY360_05055 [Verrucomicrobia bacterium]|nr:hypothetical protein [Verrucomicrobiota bacterium]
MGCRCSRIKWLAPFFLAVALQAAESPISIVLFSTEPVNTFRWERWSEAIVRIKNEGAALNGVRLVVQFPTVTDGVQTLFTRPVKLPAMSTQDVKLMVRFPSASAMPRTAGKGFPVQARLMRENITLVQDIFYSIPLAEEGVSALWIEGGDNGLAYQIKKAAKHGGALSDPGKSAPAAKGKADTPKRREFSIEVAPSYKMPHRALAYDPFDIVILSSWGAKGMDELQTEALLNWVRRGGQLIVIAGAHWLERPSRSIAEALAMWPVERYRVSVIPELETITGDLGIADGVFVMDGPRGPGAILMGNEDQPFLLRRRVGLGNTWFLTVDVDRRSEPVAPGLLRLMRSVVGVAAETASRPPSLSTPSARNILERLVAVKILAREQIGLWLAIYVAVVVVAMGIARLFRRPEWGYGVVVIAAIAGFICFHQQSRLQRRQSSGQVERVRTYLAELKEGMRESRVTGLEGFFPSDMRQIRLAMGHFDSTVFALSGFGADRAEVIEFQTRDHTGIGAWQIAANTLRAAAFDTLLNVPENGVRFTGHLTRDGLLLEIESHLPWKLAQAFLKWNRLVMPMPDLVGKKRLRIETWKRKEEWGRYQHANIQGGISLARDLMRQMIFPDPPRTWGNRPSLQRLIQTLQGNTGHTVVVGGFAEGEPSFWKKDGMPEAQASLGLWVVTGTDDLLTADSEFFSPPGLLGLQLGGKEGRISYLGGGNFSGAHEDLFLAKFLLPSCLRGATAEEILVHGEFESLHFVPHAEIGFSTAATEPQRWIPLAWASPMEAPASSAAFAAGNDAVWVRVKVARKEGTRPPSSDGLAGLTQNWSLRGLDVSIRGKLKSK